MKHPSAAFLLPALSLASRAAASPSGSRSTAVGTATVDLHSPLGAPQFLGSGFIYGFPDNGVQPETVIPDHLVTGFKFNANRAGGAQIPAKGWATGGLAGYQARFDSALSNYRTTRKYGGEFILLPHDIWGADGGQGASVPYPGDGGDWENMEAFWNQLISDLKANNMLDGLVLDLWNEPDLDIFWARSWDQYLEYFVRATKLVRSQLPRTLISGPSMANAPSATDTNWQSWCAAVAGNGTVPDHYSWHQIGSQLAPDGTVPIFNSLRQRYGLPERPVEVNEYAWPYEQNPAGAVFYLSQFERHDIRALRANWGSGSDLHDYLANLVGKTNTAGKDVYYPNGEWQLYAYYAAMTGQRVGTAASQDGLFDVFATVDGKGVKGGRRAKVIAGMRTQAAPKAYDVKVSGLGSLGLGGRKGTVDVRTYRFDYTGPFGRVDAPVDLGWSKYAYSDDVLVLHYDPPTNWTAYAYEFGGKE
ncbi:glycoside hydrolase superfamily [Coniochaeta sp. 2T2.1]|nr:glycoside hydrolase superfamily [Coniochaeta sp. 2T2.1]